MRIKQIISPLNRLFSQKNLIKWTGRDTIFPFYHSISDQDLPYISNLYPLRSVREFKQDLDYFCKHFTPVDIDEVYQRVQSKGQNLNPAFHLSFDDGLKEVYEIVAPILEEKGIPATFFINTNFIDNKDLFYRYKVGLILDKMKSIRSEDVNENVEVVLKEYSKWQVSIKTSLIHLNYHDKKVIDELAELLNIDFGDWLAKHSPYLSTAQISNLIERGFAIGSHSVDHPRFKNIDLAQQKIQIEQSFMFLENNFGLNERIFSFPFGDESVSAELFDWMYEEGNCKLSFGVSGIKDDYYPNHLHRIPMDECQVSTSKFIKSEFLYFMLKSTFNKNQIKRN